MAPPSTDFDTLVSWYQTHAVPQRFHAAIVFASVAVSALGSYTTLLLLGRRTSNHGLKNFVLLIMAATTMASVGIWGMHFIGMHMRFEPAQGIYWWLSFNAGWTVFSLFVPLLALIMAFIFLGSQSKFSYWRIFVAGILFGGIVCLMHYTAAFNTNFRVTYKIVYVVFSVVFACLAGVGGLLIFFRWRAQWQENWWKRLLAAMVLAAGVCAMHYCAVGGSSYFVKPDEINTLEEGKNKSTVISIAISAMCAALCLIALLVVLSDIRHNRRQQKAGKEISVVSATFDKKGNLLVKADGTLPLQVIKMDDMPKDIFDELDNKRPLFQWLYSLSWDWTILEPFADRIASKAFGLQLALKSSKLTPSSKTAPSSHSETSSTTAVSYGQHPMQVDDKDKRTSTVNQGGVYLPFNTASNAHAKQMRKQNALNTFKDKFLEASFLLANEFDISYSSIGLLFDKVIETGTFANSSSTDLPLDGKDAVDVEKNTNTNQNNSSLSLPLSIAGAQVTGNDRFIKKGGMLILVREISGTGHDIVEKYTNKGYRFSEPKFLSPMFSSKLGIERNEVAGLLKELRAFSKRGNKPVVQPNGTYIGLFAVKANDGSVKTSTGSTGNVNDDLDTLVYSFARHQIPAYRLPEISNVINLGIVREWLNSLSGKNLEYVRKRALEDSLKYAEAIQARERREQLKYTLGGHIYDDEPEEEEEDILGLGDLSPSEQIEISTFQSSFYVAIDAMCLALRNNISDLPNRAILSSEILEVPSSLDDSTDPAEMILFNTVLPPSTQGSTSLMYNDPLDQPQDVKPSSALVTGIPRYGDSFVNVPTFVFTPFSLFNRSQNSLLKGRYYKDFHREIRLELIRRYPPAGTHGEYQNVDLGDGVGTAKSGFSGPDDAGLSVQGVQGYNGRAGGRKSIVDFGPVLDKSRGLGKIWEKKENSEGRTELSSDGEEIDVIDIKAGRNGRPKSSESLSESQKRMAGFTPSAVQMQEIGNLDNGVSTLSNPAEAAFGAGYGGLGRRGSLQNQYGQDQQQPVNGVSFGASALAPTASIRQPPTAFGGARAIINNSNNQSPPGSADNAAYQIMLAAYNNGTAAGLPGYRGLQSQPSSLAGRGFQSSAAPPPTVPLPSVPATNPPMNSNPTTPIPGAASVEGGTGEAQAPASYTAARRPSQSSSVKPTATAARFRSDGWVNRAMREIEYNNTSSRVNNSAW